MENLRNLAVLVLGCSGDDVGIADAAQGDVGVTAVPVVAGSVSMPTN